MDSNSESLTPFGQQSRRTRIDATAHQHKELAKLERERVRIVDAIKDGLPADMVRDDAERISSRMEVLKRTHESEPAPEPILHPAMADMYAREVQRLIKTLNAYITAKKLQVSSVA